MKKIAIITPVPEMVNAIIEQSMLRKGAEEKVVEYNVVDLREFGKGNYRQIDDTPFGGGSGMVMMAEPLMSAVESALEWINDENVRVVFPSPQGQTWNHNAAESFSEHDHTIFICGHYKGIDQRVIEKYVTNEFSIGDFVVTSGEIPAMIMIDSMVRLMPGVLNSRESAETDSFYNDLLDNPHFTKPREVDGMKVPDLLLNGHHQEIHDWRQSQKEKITEEKRPDLWRSYLEKSAISE
ncbi:MAG TPA: tRNA (guanosine(37)-N1)-methyltransferase TrmD [Candidatus Marinimicrobia bacterium]|nr:tRNA (guanosine(37)-N1)-methyltransferase TrmD [Candidatus Neomarinimicrobiota bacterium]HJM69372.1 tRNA (guanosine(37)-N1)-methyltransferase TrmD [Candidatus Neomarinimicrobiota bacterium]